VTKDGEISYWALQVWQRELPDGGQPANATQRSYELQVSHWTGALPVLWLKWDWIYDGTYDHLYGKMTYGGTPVYGFGSTDVGNPTDSFGRNIYVDTKSPPWHTGYRQAGDWYRWNGFLTKRPLGNFCAGVYKNQYGRAVAGTGKEYRATAMGPGVTPIVMWHGPPPGQYQSGGFGTPADYNIFPDHQPTDDGDGNYQAGPDKSLDKEQIALAMQAGAGTKSAVCAKVHDPAEMG
jgi:hypothetical protein